MAISSAQYGGGIVPTRPDITPLTNAIAQQQANTQAYIAPLLEQFGVHGVAANALQGDQWAQRYFQMIGQDPSQYVYQKPDGSWEAKTGTWAHPQYLAYRVAASRLQQNTAEGAPAQPVTQDKNAIAEGRQALDLAGKTPPAQAQTLPQETAPSREAQPAPPPSAPPPPAPPAPVSVTPPPPQSVAVVPGREAQLTPGDSSQITPPPHEMYSGVGATRGWGGPMTASNYTRTAVPPGGAADAHWAGMRQYFLDTPAEYRMTLIDAPEWQNWAAQIGKTPQAALDEMIQELGGYEKVIPPAYRPADTGLSRPETLPLDSPAGPQQPTERQPGEIPDYLRGQSSIQTPFQLGSQIRENVDKMASSLSIAPDAAEASTVMSAARGTVTNVVAQDPKTRQRKAIVNIAGEPHLVSNPEELRKAEFITEFFNNPDSGRGRHGEGILLNTATKMRPVIRREVRNYYSDEATQSDFNQAVRTYSTDDPYVNMYARMIMEDPDQASIYFPQQVEALLNARLVQAQAEQAKAAADYSTQLAQQVARQNTPENQARADALAAEELRKLRLTNDQLEKTVGYTDRFLAEEYRKIQTDNDVSDINKDWTEEILRNQVLNAEIQRWATQEGIKLDWAKFGLTKEAMQAEMDAAMAKASAETGIDISAILKYITDPEAFQTLSRNAPDVASKLLEVMDRALGGAMSYSVERRGLLGIIPGVSRTFVNETLGAPSPGGGATASGNTNQTDETDLFVNKFAD